MSQPLSLTRQLRRSERRRKLISFALVAPLLVFLLFCFGFPIAGMLWRAVEDKEVGIAFPQTVAALQRWDSRALPDESIYRLLVSEIKQAQEAETLAVAARRLNYDMSGFRSLLFNTARRLPAQDTSSFKDEMLHINPAWGDIAHWGAIRNAGGSVSLFYLLAAIDLKMAPDGSITARPGEDAIFLNIFARTFWMAGIVTTLCLLIGFPLSYLLATVPTRISYPMLVFVLVPFWTSLLVRTAAWVVLLQNNGVVNDFLRTLHIVEQPIALIYNRVGVNFSMTHILLPFFILPLYSVMRGISPSHMRAAASLGAGPRRAFFKVYLPQCAPGLTAGCLLVFTIALGFYITPALIGGAGDQMVSYYIAFYTNTSANWGLACALSAWLLATTLVLYGVYNRLVNVSAGLAL
jgi:putative spermidine/putrescine transport system permease protein